MEIIFIVAGACGLLVTPGTIGIIRKKIIKKIHPPTALGMTEHEWSQINF